MVRHLVMWNFKEDFPEEKKDDFVAEANARLGALVGKVKGLNYVKMTRAELAACNRDLLLYCELDTPEDAAAYQVNPLHVAIADELVKPATCDRACFDYVVES